MQPVIAATWQMAPIVVGAAALALRGVDDVAAFGGVLLIQAVFSAASLLTALTRRLVLRSWKLPAWIDVPFLIGAPAIAAIPLVGFALTAGGVVALVLLAIAGVSHGYAGVVLDRWAKE